MQFPAGSPEILKSEEIFLLSRVRLKKIADFFFYQPKSHFRLCMCESLFIQLQENSQDEEGDDEAEEEEQTEEKSEGSPKRTSPRKRRARKE